MHMPYVRTALITISAGALLLLQGCGLLVAGGAGAAGGYAASQEGYEVQSPVKKDTAGGYKPQSPVIHNEDKGDGQAETEE